MSVFIDLIVEVLSIQFSLGTVSLSLGGVALGVLILSAGYKFFASLSSSGISSPFAVLDSNSGTDASLDFSDVWVPPGSPWGDMSGREPEYEPDFYE
jgi:hypothetical protein